MTPLGKHWKLSEITRERISAIRIKKGLSKGKNNPFYGIHNYGEKHPMWGKKHSKKTREKMSLNHADFSGKNHPHYGKPAYHGKGTYYKGIWMRSSWEIRIAQLLDKAKMVWQYEFKRFMLKDLTYCPDFYLPKYNLWIEVKGWMNPKSKERIKQFQKLYPQENLLIIDEFLYKKYCKV